MIARLLGVLLRGRHAGEAHLLGHELPVEPDEVQLHLSSTAFTAGGTMPPRYAGEGVGDNVSPPLRWSQPPQGTVELVLAMEDPDAPLRRPFVHLIAAGIDPFVTGFTEGVLSGNGAAVCLLGITTFRQLGYSGPRALPGHGPHRYVFQLFALGERSGLARGARRAAQRTGRRAPRETAGARNARRNLRALLRSCVSGCLMCSIHCRWPAWLPVR